MNENVKIIETPWHFAVSYPDPEYGLPIRNCITFPLSDYASAINKYNELRNTE